MALLGLLKTLSLVEWIFWGIILFYGMKGYIAYPNLLKENGKKSVKDSTLLRTKSSF